MYYGKGAENAGYQQFLLFPLCFQLALSSEVVKSLDYMAECLLHLSNALYKASNQIVLNES